MRRGASALLLLLVWSSDAGLFDSFASNLFVAHSAVVKLVGEQVLQGTDAIHFTYEMPRLSGNWSVNWLGAQGDVAESGEFWVEKQSLRLLRLAVAATDFPLNVALKSLNIVIDYQMLAIDGKSALIPSHADVLAVEINGQALRNTTVFSQCHLFEAESKISDSMGALAALVAQYEANREPLRANLNLPIALETEIRRDSAKLGDPVLARLQTRLKISAELAIPRNAVVKGRVREFRPLADSPETYEVGLEFNEIDWPGHIGIFYAEPVSIQQLVGVSSFLSRGATRTLDSSTGLMSTTETISPAEIPGVATFFLTGSSVIPKGFQMTWRTRKTKHP
jgi:hypothetical protein